MWETGCCLSLLFCTLSPYSHLAVGLPSLVHHLRIWASKPVLPGEACIAALLSLLLVWVGNAKHALFKMLQQLLNVRAVLGHRCACHGWPGLPCVVVGEVRACVAVTPQSGMCSFLHCISFAKYIHIDSLLCMMHLLKEWRVFQVSKTESCPSNYSYLRVRKKSFGWNDPKSFLLWPANASCFRSIKNLDVFQSHLPAFLVPLPSCLVVCQETHQH